MPHQPKVGEKARSKVERRGVLASTRQLEVELRMRGGAWGAEKLDAIIYRHASSWEDESAPSPGEGRQPSPRLRHTELLRP